MQIYDNKLYYLNEIIKIRVAHSYSTFMNADTSWRIWRSDLYSGPNTSVNHESAGTAGFKYVDWRPSQTPTRVFSISGTSPLKKPWENQLGTGPRVMRWHWQNHSTPFLRGHQERRPQQGGGEKEYAREYAGRIRRAKREREAQKRKNEKKNICYST